MRSFILTLVVVLCVAVFSATADRSDCRECKQLALTNKNDDIKTCRERKRNDEFTNKNLFRACKAEAKSEYFSDLANCYNSTSGACA